MKKILITMLIALTMCLFLAFSVSAEEYELVDNLGTPGWYTGNYELIKDKDAQVVLSNGNGTYTRYPAYYVLKYSITVKDGAVTEAYVNGFDYSFINDSLGTSYKAGDMYKVELPEGLTTVKNGFFGHNPKEPNVVELIMSDTITSVSSHAFRETTNLKKVVVSKNLKSLGGYAFYRAKGLEEVIFRGGSEAELDVSGDNIFFECTALKELDLSNRKIISLGSSFLSKCSNLGKVTLPESLESTGYCSIFNNPKMYFASDFLPQNFKTAGQHFLSGCVNINKAIYFPEGFEGFTATYNFSSDQSVPADITLVFLGKMEGDLNLLQASVSNGRKITLIFTKNQFSDLTGKFVTACDDGTIAYIGKTASEGNNYVSQEGTLALLLGNPSDANTQYKVNEDGDILYYVNSKTYNIFFCGGDKVELCHNVRSTNVEPGYNNYITTPFAFDRAGHMDGGIHYDLTKVESFANCGVDGVTSHTCVLCDRVVREVVSATGDHTLYEVSACADKCEVCLQYVQKANQSHTIVEYFTYENGYMNNGEYGERCTNEGCDCKTTEVKGALVCDLGYSVPEGEGLMGVTYGYRANKAVLGDYERVNNCKAELGLLIATGENFAKDQKIFEFKFAVMLDCVDITVNYGDRTDLSGCELVIAAVLYQTKNGETEKVCLQGETEKVTTAYTSQTYGTLYGISFDSLKR